MFENFKLYKVTVGVPTMTVTKSGVGINKQTIVKLDYAKYIRIMISSEDKKVAIIATNDKTDETHDFCVNKVKPINIRLNYKDFTNTLYSLSGISDKKIGFRVEGDYIPDHKAIIFNFNDVTPVK